MVHRVACRLPHAEHHAQHHELRGRIVLDLKQQLENYANIIVRVGLNVQRNQDLLISAPIEAAEFVRHVVAKAYEVGALNVVVNWEDEQVTRIRFLQAPDESFTEFPAWRVQQLEELVERDGAYLAITARDPDLMKGVDPQRLAVSQKVGMTATEHFSEATKSMRISWLIAAIPTQAWAAKVFPNLDSPAQIPALWDAILSTSRATGDDPLQNWQQHIEELQNRAAFMNDKRFAELHYKSAVTDLTVELPNQHLWVAASSTSASGTHFVPNIPTEEVFTMPKRDGVNGVVQSTKPLNHGGVTIDQFTLKFEHGRIVDYSAESGYEALKQIIETDEGAHYLGEVALVPYNSPISQTGVLFYNTLFDENASCHLAIGDVIPVCTEGGESLNREELMARGANYSLTHVDFMMGSSDMNIDGVTHDGETVPLFRNGNWV